MAKLKQNQFWKCIKFPSRSIKLLMRFRHGDGEGYPHRREGWMAQGFDGGRAYGSAYEITERAIKNGFSRSNFVVFTLRRLIKLRMRIYFYFE